MHLAFWIFFLHLVELQDTCTCFSEAVGAEGQLCMFPEGLWNSHHAIWKEYKVALRKETTGTKALGLECYFQMRWLSTWDIQKKGRWMLGSQHSRETSASSQQPHLPPQVWLKNQEEHWQMLSGFKGKHDRLWRKPMKPHWVSLKRKK